METKHTKGEWYAKDGQIYPIETGKTLALIPYFDKDNKEHSANQKLIEAAPKLLEALKCVEMALFELNIKETAINSIVTKAIKEATE